MSQQERNPLYYTTSLDWAIGPKNDDGLKHVFDHLDVDKDGKISSTELTDYLASVGESVSHKVAERVVNEFDSDGDELLDFGDFVKLMKQEDKGEMEDVLRSAFEKFEVEKGCGCITPKGLQQMLRQLGDVKSHDECAAMIRPFDLDGNGFLDFHEFQQMMSPAS
ncbi:putative calcium-binding protein CML41, partial [Mucuna pruriens]